MTACNEIALREMILSDTSFAQKLDMMQLHHILLPAVSKEV